MWRNLVAVLLLHSLMAAQVEQDWPAQPGRSEHSAPKLSEPTKPKPATLHQYTFYDAIRRGTREEVAVQVSLSGFVTIPSSPVAGIVPLKLELQPSEGLTFSKFRYPKTFKQKVTFQAEPIPVTWMPVIRFKLHANDSATLGVRILNGKLTFQPIHLDSSLGPVQQLDVAIPITVAEHDARVNKTQWPYPHMPVGVVVALIVLSPVLIPLALVYYPVCALLGPQRCPD